MNTLKIATPAINAPNHVTSAKTALPAALTLGLLAALFALTPQAIGQTRTRPDLSETAPIPTRMVLPRLRTDYVGVKLEMTFRIDKSGSPYDVGATDILADRDLVTQLKSVINFWQFVPAKDGNGNPVDRKVTLAVTILPPKDGNEARVAFSYTK